MTTPDPSEAREMAAAPGPWTVELYGDGDSLVIHSGPDERVCFMATPGESPGAMERIERNANLIAAAPAMRDALRDCQRVLARLTQPDMSESIQHLWAECVAAETKARAALSHTARKDGDRDV